MNVGPTPTPVVEREEWPRLIGNGRRRRRRRRRHGATATPTRRRARRRPVATAASLSLPLVFSFHFFPFCCLKVEFVLQRIARSLFLFVFFLSSAVLSFFFPTQLVPYIIVRCFFYFLFFGFQWNLFLLCFPRKSLFDLFFQWRQRVLVFPFCFVFFRPAFTSFCLLLNSIWLISFFGGGGTRFRRSRFEPARNFILFLVETGSFFFFWPTRFPLRCVCVCVCVCVCGWVWLCDNVVGIGFGYQDQMIPTLFSHCQTPENVSLVSNYFPAVSYVPKKGVGWGVGTLTKANRTF